MADILYNYGQIDQAVADMRAGVNSLNTKLEDMDSELKQLQSSWDGQAKRAYDASKAKWTEGMDGIVEILPMLVTLMASAPDSA